MYPKPHSVLPSSLRYPNCTSGSVYLLLPLLCLAFAGCATSNGTQMTGTSSAPNTAGDLTGNWQATVSASTGSPVTAFAGSVTETSSTSDSGQYTMALLQFTGPCFVAAPLVPMQGNVKASSVALDSYTVNGQDVHIQASANAASTGLTGTYSVQNGCANGASGSFSATRYAPLTGTYNGTVAMSGAAALKASVTVAQQTNPTGSGTFLLTGTLNLSGTGCTLSAMAGSAAANAARGSAANLTFAAADGSGSTVTLVGTFDPAAAALTPSTFTVTGGSCAGTYTASPFTR